MFKAFTGDESFLAKLKRNLSKTRDSLSGKLRSVVTGHKSISEELYEELEEVLIQSDLGVETSMALVEELRKRSREKKLQDPEQLRMELSDLIKAHLRKGSGRLCEIQNRPTVFLVVGVNGSGKTTTIAKLARKYKEEGYKVILGAADTFRAAAIDQLNHWAERTGVDIIKHQEGSDPAAVAYDAVKAAVARNADLLIIDTAGRLHTKTNLMHELEKINRVIEREIGRRPDETLLVVDSTTGQNALSQARVFSESVNLSGIVLTKLDGTAKGGVVISIASELGIPVKLIGIGEGYDDLREFEPDAFTEAILG